MKGRQDAYAPPRPAFQHLHDNPALELAAVRSLTRPDIPRSVGTEKRGGRSLMLKSLGKGGLVFSDQMSQLLGG